MSTPQQEHSSKPQHGIVKVVFDDPQRQSGDISERYWGNGKVFRMLADATVRTAAPSTVCVGWFGENNKAKIEFAESQPVESLKSMQLRSHDEWLEAVCNELSDTIRNDADAILRLLLQGHAVLVTGSSGMGKSVLVSTIASEGFPSAAVCLIHGGGESSPNTVNMVKRIEECEGILILDDVDWLLPKRNASNADRKRCSLLIRAIARAKEERGIMVLAASFRPEQVNSDAFGFGLLDRTHRIRAPNHMERSAQLRRRGLPQENAELIAQRSSGWSRAELDSLSRAIHLYQQRHPTTNNEALFSKELARMLVEARKNTSIYRDSAFVIPSDEGDSGESADEIVSSIAGTVASEQLFSSPRIGGLVQTRRMLTTFVVGFLESPTTSGMRGILLHGPSGNGKTLVGLELGRYIQRRGLANFVCVRCLDLVSKVVGETEQNVSRVFARARDCSPCLLFLDQLEALVPRRKTGEDETTTERTFERVLSLVLTELDGILTKDLEGKVVVMAAVRAVQELEPAVVRPGRLGLHVLVDPPSTSEERMQVIRVCTHRMPISSLQPEFLQNMSEYLLAGRSRAEIANVCREAATLALRENVDADQVTEDHFSRAIRGV